MSEKSKQHLEKYLDLGHNQVENHAKTQQKIFEKKTGEHATVTRKLSEFFKTNIVAFAWHYLRSRFGVRHPYWAYPRHGQSGCFRLQSSRSHQDGVTLALASDWASDTVESDRIGALIATHVPDYTIHLGDIYFVGTEAEVRENFTAPYASWYYGPSGSLALSGNHEMYSNGNAYFNHLLPAMYVREGETVMTQQAGFFCLENDHWRIIGLDTGYTSVERPLVEIISPPDCHLRKEQLAWLRDVVKIGDPADRRGIVILSHHPYLSAFREAYSRPAEQLQELMGEAQRPIIWFWGHDHRMVLYKMAQIGHGPMVYGRCIGHGGMPVETDPAESKEEQAKILLYDRRVRVVVKGHPVGYNGFVKLSLQGPELEAQYIDLDNRVVAREHWLVDTKNGQLDWELIESLSELAE
ncbi:calcineurin-like phosphoesterase family protein [Dyadobacter jejuensis]|uniref:Calcineurin-like phosphoesterase family protein n=1 Tax=Dyadobacter jejuensis TaxID=1082580 RepID=A0A316ASG6_9BACT|nr:metallophosphoesterase [Dyadobacter jejuensis]PWJ60635.1 calcineurin-like phosphoesterase family protein [Dyadobacter jejuensis]